MGADAKESDLLASDLGNFQESPVLDKWSEWETPRQRRARTRGLPKDENLLKLARVWLTAQHKAWPQLAEAGQIPANTPEAAGQLVEQFVQRFSSRGGKPFEHGLPQVPWNSLGTVYLRYSSAHQNPRSLDDQLQIVLSRAEQERVFIPWEYTFADASVTGTTSRRTGYVMAQRVLEFTGTGAISTIYLDEIDRASRDGLQILTLGTIVQNHRKRMVGVSSNFDSTTEQSRIMLHSVAMFNDYYITQHRAKVDRGKRGAARRKTINGKPPVGIKAVPAYDKYGQALRGRAGMHAKTAAVDEQWSWAIVLLAELFVDKRWSANRIAKEFNRRQIGGKTSWYAALITKMLRNRGYVGIFIYGMSRQVRDPLTGTIRHVPQPRSGWIVSRIPEAQIWSWGRWKQIQARLKEVSETSPHARNRKRKPKPAGLVYPKTLFSNILHCGYCGRRLTLRRGGGYPCFYCMAGPEGRDNCQLGTSKAASVFEPFLLRFILDSILTDERMAELVDQANRHVSAEAAKPPVDVAGLQTSLRDAKAKRDRLIELVADDVSANLSAVRTRISSLEKEVRELTTAVREAERQKEEEVPPLDLEQMKVLLADLRQVLNQHVPAANEMLKKLLGRVYVTQKSVPDARRPVWVAHFDTDMVPALADHAARRCLPSSYTLMKLTVWEWKMPIKGEIEIGGRMPVYERLAKKAGAMRAEGALIKQIAEEFGVSVNIIRNAIRFNDTGIRPARAKKQPRKNIYHWIAKETVRLKKQGLTYRQIADRLGVTKRQVGNAYHKMVGRYQKPAIPGYQRIAERAYQLRQEGMTHARIGTILGYNKVTVKRALRWFCRQQHKGGTYTDAA
ncbi:recombinase family protein [Phycisphaerales bacterium AB-hyl4]|uniref:Recombinase family protein n=1 Tax=Natronomicrosphaera hydrolytica TaxID=3242702 RepID=A0ABV4U1D7_9BACT